MLNNEVTQPVLSSVRLLYSSLTTLILNSWLLFFFFKKFKYLFGTHVKETGNKNLLAKTNTKHPFYIKNKNTEFLFSGRKTSLISRILLFFKKVNKGEQKR